MIRDAVGILIITVSFMFFSMFSSFMYIEMMNKIVPELNKILEDNNVSESDMAKYHELTEKVYMYGNILAYFGVFASSSAILLSFVFVYKLRMNPLVVPIMVILYFLMLLVSMVMSNMYVNIRDEIYSQFPDFKLPQKADWYYSNLPYIMMFAMFVIMMIGYSKRLSTPTFNRGDRLEVV